MQTETKSSHAASGSGTTTIVNAAFLQEVKESNSQLWAILAELREIQPIEDAPREVCCQFVDKLGELRDALGLEFSLEETYGFITGVRQPVGLGTLDAASAKIQHRELYLQILEICEQVEEAQYRGTIGRDLPIYVGAFEQFSDAFNAHEELEDELIRCGLGTSGHRY